jgi:uncharacterized protein YkwD
MKTLIFFVGIFLLTPNSFARSAKHEEGGGNIVAMTNRLRTHFGLKPVRSDAALNALAQSWAAEMNHSGNYDHPFDLRSHLARARPRSAGAQNIAIKDSAATAMKAWTESSEHLANMLNPNMIRMGVGHSGRYWVQDFAD